MHIYPWQMYPPPSLLPSHCQEQYYVRSSWHWLSLWVTIKSRCISHWQEILPFSTFSSFCHLLSDRSDNPPQIQQVNYTMLLTQITYTVLYKHSALLSYCLCFCIISPNVWKCYKDYLHLRPIYSYILPLAVYSGGQDQYYIRSSWHCEEASGGQEQYYIRSSWHCIILWVTLTFRHSITPLTKNEKMSICTGKKCLQRLENLYTQDLGMPIAMHYVRTLCDKYFLSYYGFSSFFTGRSRYRVLKHGVEVQWDPRRTAEYIPSHFNGF